MFSSANGSNFHRAAFSGVSGKCSERELVRSWSVSTDRDFYPRCPDFSRKMDSFPIVLSRFACVNSPSRGNCLLLRPRRNARHDELTMEHYRYYAGDPLTLQPYERNRISRDNYAPNFEPENVAGPTKQNSTKGGKIHPAVSGQRHDSSFFFAAACQAPASWQ